jgi:hypothetical protein
MQRMRHIMSETEGGAGRAVVLGRVDNKKFPSEQAQLQSLASIWEPFAMSGELCIGTSALRKFLEEQQEEHVKAQMPKLKAAVSSRHCHAYDDAQPATHTHTHAHNAAPTHTPLTYTRQVREARDKRAARLQEIQSVPKRRLMYEAHKQVRVACVASRTRTWLHRLFLLVVLHDVGQPP